MKKERAYERQKQQDSKRALSPFEKRLATYQNTSIMRGVNRSNSRGHMQSSNTPGNLKGQSQTDFEVASTSGANTSDISVEPNEQTANELKLLRLNLQKFGGSFETYNAALKQKVRMDALY